MLGTGAGRPTKKLVTLFLMSHYPVSVVQLSSWAVCWGEQREIGWGQRRCEVPMATARVMDSGNKQAGPVGFQAGSMPRVIKSQVLQHEDDSQNGS